MKKYLTKIEITAEAANKDEAIEIVGDYLSSNITSGIEMKCVTKPVRFYDNPAAKAMALVVLIVIGYLSRLSVKEKQGLMLRTCQTAAVQVPLKTSCAIKDDAAFKKEWESKQTSEVISFIKK